VGEIHELFVVPEMRGRGVGNAFLQRGLAYFCEICISPSSRSVFLIMHKNFTKKRDLRILLLLIHAFSWDTAGDAVGKVFI